MTRVLRERYLSLRLKEGIVLFCGPKGPAMFYRLGMRSVSIKITLPVATSLACMHLLRDGQCHEGSEPQTKFCTLKEAIY